MNKFQKIILLCCLFSYAFSLKVTNIEPSTMTFGESNEFTLTVEDNDSTEYYQSHSFYLANDDKKSIFYSMDCLRSIQSSTTFKCYVYFDTRNKIEALNNLTKTLFLDDEKTNLTVTIEKPKSLKLLDFNGEQYYSYGVSKIRFEVNLNELYKSDFSIKFGDLSITNCSLDEEKIKYLYCYYEFPENYNGQTLKLKFGDEDTEYSITINAPEEFSSIKNLNLENYCVNSSEQDVYFRVDSSYKIDKHSF